MIKASQLVPGIRVRVKPFVYWRRTDGILLEKVEHSGYREAFVDGLLIPDQPEDSWVVVLIGDNEDYVPQDAIELTFASLC